MGEGNSAVALGLKSAHEAAVHFPGVAYFVREMRMLSRSLPQMFLRIGIGVAYLFAIGTTVLVSGTASAPIAPGQGLLTVFSSLNWFLIHAVALLYFTTVLGDEKEAQSRDLLLATGLGPFSMLLGAAFSRQLVAVVLIAVQLPVLVLCYALGGVEMRHIGMTMGLLLGTLLALSSGMLLASVLGRTTRACLLIGTVLLVGWLQLWRELRALFRQTGGNGAAALEGLASLDFFPVLGVEALLSVGCFFLAAGILHFRIAGSMRSARIPKGSAVAPVLGRRPARVWPRFPIAWKDIHFTGGGILWRNIRLVTFLCLAVYFDPEFSPHLSSVWDQLGLVLQLAGLAGFFFEITIACNSLVRGEQEEKTLETLFTLPLPSRVLLRDKILAAIRLSWPFGLLLVLGVGLHVESAAAGWEAFVQNRWSVLAGLVLLGHVIAFWMLTLVFSYTSRAPGWLGASLVSGMSLIFFGSVGGILHEAAGQSTSWLLPVLLFWLVVIGFWILREVFKDFERNLIYPE